MQVYGDGVVIEPGLVRGAEYTYFIESKAVIWVQSPELQQGGAGRKGVPLFFLALSVAALAGIVLNQEGAILFLPIAVVAIAAFVSLVKSFAKQKAGEWKLLVGAGEATALIYSTYDAQAFETKRNEIEQALLGRPLNEEM